MCASEAETHSTWVQVAKFWSAPSMLAFCLFDLDGRMLYNPRLHEEVHTCFPVPVFDIEPPIHECNKRNRSTRGW